MTRMPEFGSGSYRSSEPSTRRDSVNALVPRVGFCPARRGRWGLPSSPRGGKRRAYDHEGRDGSGEQPHADVATKTTDLHPPLHPLEDASPGGRTVFFYPE